MTGNVYVEASEDPKDDHPILIGDHKISFSLKIREAEEVLRQLPEAIARAKAAERKGARAA